MKITGKQVVSAVKQSGGIDPNWRPAQQKAMEKYLEKDLADALSNLLDQPASAELILAAQLKHVETFVGCGALRKILTAAFPNDKLISQRIATAETQMKKLAGQMSLALADFDDLLKQNGLQERDYLMTMNLKPGTANKILQRQMTIGELLIDQPRVILDIRFS